MTTVAILPVPGVTGEISFQAVSGTRQSLGRTAGEAPDAITPLLVDADAGTLIVVQYGHSDRFFTANQQRRLAELMNRWRAARDAGAALAAEEQTELETLVEAELAASAERAAVLADASGR